MSSAIFKLGVRCPVIHRETTALSAPSWRANSFWVQPRSASSRLTASMASDV